MKIIGDKEKPKHDLPTGSSRVSATIYRFGSTAGTTGPTAFLPPGKQRKAGYTDAFLVQHGAPAGSMVVMTPTGYMTEDAWVEMAPKMAMGIRSMPVIVDMPDWWVLKIIDGFGAHTSSDKAMEIYSEKKILLIKEEGDTSHVCQMYDQKVAIDDKKSMRQSLAYLRESNKLIKGTIDGWQLIHVALAAVRELDSDSWIYSANKVNLKPSTRVSFEEWCKRISHYLQCGESSFKPEAVRDTYRLLSPFWHGMEPVEKKLAASIVKRFDNIYSIECVKELMDKVNVPLSEMQSLRVALDLALVDPSHLERSVPEATAVLAQPAEVLAAQANVVDVASGLVTFQLHPKAPDGSPLFKGTDLFDHLINMGRRSVPAGVDLVPCPGLNVEYTQQQQRLINPKAMDYAMHEIAKHAHGEDAKQAMARRKLDNLGYIQGQCGVSNDAERRRRLKNQLQLTASLAAINKEKDNAKAASNSLETAKLIEAAPAALVKLKEKDSDYSKLTMPEMCAIAFKHFKGVSLKGNKAAHVKQLAALCTQQAGVLTLALDALPPAAPLPAARLAPTHPDARSQDESDDAGSQDKSDLCSQDGSDDARSQDESDLAGLDEIMPAAKPIAANATLCDWGCDAPEMTAAEIELGYCSGRRCKAKMHPACFLRHAGAAGAALDDVTCFCRSCWAQQ